MEAFSSAREFQLWDYYISFGQLLIRSVPSAQSAETRNIDLTFRGTFYVEMPATLTGLAIDAPTSDELTHLVERTGVAPDPTGKHHKYFVLVSRGQRYYVG